MILYLKGFEKVRVDSVFCLYVHEEKSRVDFENIFINPVSDFFPSKASNGINLKMLFNR